MSSDYGYINARVRGLKSKLLGPEFYRDALDGSDFRAFTSALAQSPYMHELEEAQARFEGLGAVDRAVARNVFRTARSMLGFSDGTPRALLGLMLMRFDLANIKAIARGKHAGKGADEIQGSLFPAGELKPATLEEAAVATDMGSAAQLLAFGGGELTTAFHRAARRYHGDHDLYALELALDKAYYRAVGDRARALGAPVALLRYLEREVDAANLRTALKLRGQGADAELFLAGGHEVRRTFFDALMSDGDASALQALNGTAFAAVASVEGLSAAEAVIRGVLDRSARRLAADPLGPGVALDYLRRKEAEAARLRLLARGKYYGVPREALERELGHA